MINIDSRVSFVSDGDLVTGTVFLLQRNTAGGNVEAHIRLDTGGAASVLVDELTEMDEDHDIRTDTL